MQKFHSINIKFALLQTKIHDIPYLLICLDEIHHATMISIASLHQ